jgi:uncharacterized protein (DUF934 family)
MPRLIRGGRVDDDACVVLRDARDFGDVPDRGYVHVPLALWQSERARLLARGSAGVWLAPADDPAGLADDVHRLRVIAVDFPAFADGRGYSTARLLRERLRFAGELRAVGDVLRDQLYLLAECGFDAFSLREDRDAADALHGLADFTGVYAPTTRTPQPRFRRAAAAPAWFPEI